MNPPLCRGTGAVVVNVRPDRQESTRAKVLELVEACRNCFVRFEGDEVDCIQYLDSVADFDKPDPAYEALCNFLGV